MSTTHGMTSSVEYDAWANITGRCENDKHPSYVDYGGRGIRVFHEWLGPGGFARFFAYVGLRPDSDYTIERIDNNKGYEPGNVKWATRREQGRNRRSNHIIEIDGVRKVLTDWASEQGLHFTTICHRIARGMTEREAVMTPPRFVGRRASKIREGITP